MTLHEAVAETMRRAEKEQEFIRRTLEQRRKEAEVAQAREKDRLTMTDRDKPQKRD